MASSKIVTGISKSETMLAHDTNALASGKGSSCQWTAASLLQLFAAEFRECSDLELEFSLRLGRGTLQSDGRFACWINGSQSEDFSCMARLLHRIGAPAPVLAAQQEQQLPVRQAIAVAVKEESIEFRLYLHSRDPRTLGNCYLAWRWRDNEAPRRSEYVFHFMPETASGISPISLVPGELHPALEHLLEEPLLQQMSGFWLRYGEQGRIDQLDIALPWHPPAKTVAGVCELLRALAVPEKEFDAWGRLPIRHVAISVGEGLPSVTLYASASLTGSFPITQEELQTRVLENSLAAHQAITQDILQQLLPPAKKNGADLGAFYDGPIETWQAILGAEMHYHAGIFDSEDMNPSDQAMTQALHRAVTELYPFLPAGGRIYDLGCGWGGPLEMFIRDLRCPSLGLTISRRQFQHIAARRIPVRWGDAEATLPPGQFDSIVLLESLSHIRDKQRLLQVLWPFTKRLVMRVNCQDSAPAEIVFGGSMHVISSSALRAMLEAAGWEIIQWRDRRREALPSVAVWHRRLQSLPPTNDHHLETFRAWCARVMTFPDDWAAHNPLIEVVAVHT